MLKKLCKAEVNEVTAVHRGRKGSSNLNFYIKLFPGSLFQKLERGSYLNQRVEARSADYFLVKETLITFYNRPVHGQLTVRRRPVGEL